MQSELQNSKKQGSINAVTFLVNSHMAKDLGFHNGFPHWVMAEMLTFYRWDQLWRCTYWKRVETTRDKSQTLPRRPSPGSTSASLLISWLGLLEMRTDTIKTPKLLYQCHTSLQRRHPKQTAKVRLSTRWARIDNIHCLNWSKEDPVVLILPTKVTSPLGFQGGGIMR